ncbi:uncharacterized protein LOC141655329 [Silene latifolia]|uniref:uncharacterized protein LOC141655329 n=1 Tax=Silene latifolia TaxID=37657 RepID=UPI003D788404
MWHIMNKMPKKFGVSRSDYNDFMCKINDIIWDDELEAAEFDGMWEQIIEDHGVGVNDWFADTLDNMDKHSSATASTHLALEIHAAKVYTYSAFQKFKQEAIFSIDTCRTGGFTERGELEVTTVKDSSRKKNFEVAYSPASGIKTIPEDYVVNRWMKEYLRLRIFNSNGEGTENMKVIDEKQIAMSIMWSEVHEAVRLLRDKGVADVDSFSAVIRAFKESLSPLGEVLNKNQQMEKFLNYTACEVVTILPPKNSKNKGTGKDSLSPKQKQWCWLGNPNVSVRIARE